MAIQEPQEWQDRAAVRQQPRQTSSAGYAAMGLSGLIGGVGGPAGLAITVGANLLGGILSARSERRRKKKLRQQQLANLRPLEDLLRLRSFGPSASQGNIEQAVTTRTLGDLASRGVLNSSIAAPAVASAVAPYEQQRQAGLQGLTERIVAAKNQILEGTSLPGYGGAFGQTFGETSDLLALVSGQNAARRRGGAGALSPLEEFYQGLQQEDNTGSTLEETPDYTGTYG